MGITSFVIGVFSVVGWALLICVLVAAVRTDPHADDEGTPLSYLVGGWMYGTVVLGLCGLVFGIGGVRQRDRRKSLAVAGLALNVVMPIATLLFMLFVVTYASFHDHGLATPGQTESVPADTRPPDLRSAAVAGVLGVIALGWGLRLVTRRRDARPGSAACRRCRQSLPGTAQFCRRCGLSLRAA
jgi:hypothetical protein